MENFDKESKYIRARERVEELKKFYSSLAWYIVIIVFLAGINYYSNGWHYMWFLWAAFGWGIGLIFHAIKVFQMNPFMSKNWEERKLKEYMEEENDKLSNKNRWE